MANTILVEGLPLCHAGSKGLATASAPDVCLTPAPPAPPIPIPYPNIAKDEDLVDGSVTVTADGGMSIAIEGCKLAKSVGDEGGVVGGVTSGVINGEAEFTSFASTVFVEGKAVVRHTDTLTMNKGNTVCMGGIVVPPVQAEAVSANSPEETTFLELKLVDADKIPIPNEKYQICKMDGSVAVEGNLDDEGYAYVDNLPKDKYYVIYPEYSEEEEA